jgi:hypothetical protein
VDLLAPVTAELLSLVIGVGVALVLLRVVWGFAVRWILPKQWNAPPCPSEDDDDCSDHPVEIIGRGAVCGCGRFIGWVA